MKLRHTFITLSACGALALAVGACTHSDDSGVSTDELDAANERADAEAERADQAEADKADAEAEAEAANERAEDAEDALDTADAEERGKDLLAVFDATPSMAHTWLPGGTLPDGYTPGMGKNAGMVIFGGNPLDGMTENNQRANAGVPFEMSDFRARAANGLTDANDAPSIRLDRADLRPSAGSASVHIPGGATAITLAGTYAGAPGTYTCSGASGAACTVTKAAEGYTLTGATWAFAPAPGARTGMTAAEDDSQFLTWGWWEHDSDDNGAPDRIGSYVATHGGATTSTSVNTIAGTATYTGTAVGLYALRASRNAPLEGGNFTADAMLEADFRSVSATTMISGELTNFMVDGVDKNWTVALGSDESDDSGVIADSGSGTDNTTTWTVDGVAGGADGGWDAQFYRDNGNPSDAPTGVPSDIAGTFTANYHGDDGRMIGAFGASYDGE